MIENNIQNTKIIYLNDGIDALNLIYFDTLFFMKIFTIKCDFNMNFMNGDLFLKVIHQVKKNVSQRFKFVMYTNTDKETIINYNDGIKYFLKKP